jgi:hypothetical protein
MVRWGTILAIALSLVGTRANAQESGAGPGTAEVTLIPGGGVFFASSNAEASFGNYSLGGAVTYNINRYVAVEGEVGGTLGVTQSLAFGGSTSSQKTPNTLGYTGNLVVSAPVRHGIVPYVAGGVGGLTMFQSADLGIASKTTFLTGNVGGGVKWYVNNRVGFRGDYRFITVGSSASAPAFFGQETRYGHRVYGGLILNATHVRWSWIPIGRAS